MVCRENRADRRLTLGALAVYNVPLPDLEGVGRFPRTPEETVLAARA